MNPFKLDNRGLSLVELLTSMAIASILFIGVVAFINAASTGYTTSSNQTVLQDDVQDVLNYLYDITIASSDVYTYKDDETLSGTGRDVLCILAPSSSSSKTSDEKYLLHYVCFDSDNNKLYYRKKEKTKSELKSMSTLNDLKKAADSAYLESRYDLLANNVVKFRTSIRRQSDFENVAPTALDSFNSEVKSEGAATNSVSMVSYSLTLESSRNKRRTADVAVRPRNAMDKEFNLTKLFNP